MQKTFSQGLSAPSKTLQMVMGLDVGNSATKLVGSGWRDRQSSYVVEDLTRKFQEHLGAFEYVNGDRTDLINRAFIVGDNARIAAPSKGQNVYQDSKGKVNLCLQMLLGCLSYRRHVDSAGISLVFSTANKSDMTAQEAALSGTHHVRYKGKLSTIRVNVLKALPEGYGALASQGLSKGKNICLDLGNGDVAIKIFGLGGSLVDHETFQGGVSELIQAVSEHEVFADYRHGGDRDLIRQALERGSYSYGNTGLSFETAYKAALGPWSQIALKPAMHFANPHKDTADRYIAIGGGTLLPGMSNALSKAGVSVAVNPVFASAEGMFMLGEAKNASASK